MGGSKSKGFQHAQNMQSMHNEAARNQQAHGVTIATIDQQTVVINNTHRETISRMDHQHESDMQSRNIAHEQTMVSLATQHQQQAHAHEQTMARMEHDNTRIVNELTAATRQHLAETEAVRQHRSERHAASQGRIAADRDVQLAAGAERLRMEQERLADKQRGREHELAVQRAKAQADREAKQQEANERYEALKLQVEAETKRIEEQDKNRNIELHKEAADRLMKILAFRHSSLEKAFAAICEHQANNQARAFFERMHQDFLIRFDRTEAELLDIERRAMELVARPQPPAPVPRFPADRRRPPSPGRLPLSHRDETGDCEQL